MTAALSEIIERVEGATGPDRELDAVIWQAIEPESEWGAIGRVWQQQNSTHPIADCLAPAYTSSLDAALTLVPEGWAVRDLNIWPGLRPYVSLWGTHEDGGERWHNGKDGRVRAEAAAPALALCAAALRARLATQEQQ